MNATPPALARLLMSWLTPVELRETLLGDLEEQFHEIVRHRGWSSARSWYWQQLIASWLPLQRIRLESGVSVRYHLLLFTVFFIVAMTSPLRDATVPMYLAELIGLLCSAFAIGFASSRLLTRRNGLLQVLFSSGLFLLALFIRGERAELPWMMPFMVLAILLATVTSWLFRWRVRVRGLA